MSQPITAIPASETEIHPVIQSTSSFSDRLSPMLVKELRQGLKGLSFLILFITIQAALGVVIFGAAFAETYDNTGSDISKTVFMCLAVAVLIIQPLRGISAVTSEIKNNTIDLIVLTRLTAWRIVFGKWISLVCQSALIISAVAPYLILRYFFGGMQLFPEIMVLVTMFLLSAIFIAITVGLSSIPSFIVRGIISFGLAAMVFGASIDTFIDGRSSYNLLMDLCGFASTNYTIAYFSILALGIYVAWLALDFGATFIAPAAENRSTPRRLICLAAIALAAIIFLLIDKDARFVLPLVMMAIATPVIIISITEAIYLVPSISRPFITRGALGRLSSYLFYPGWQSGLNFCVLLFGIIMITNYFTPNPAFFGSVDPSSTFFTIIPICFSCLLFPLALVRLFFRKSPQHFVFYIGGVIFTFVLFLLVIFILENTRSRDIAIIFSWLPPVQFVMYGYTQNTYNPVSYSSEIVTLIAYTSLIINWLICFLSTQSSWKYLRDNEKIARESIQ